VRKQKIIIADNNKYFREGLKAILQNICNCNLIRDVQGGFELLEQMEKEPANIVFLEVVLNGIDGVEVTRKIRKAYPSASVIAFSSLENSRYISKMTGAGANGYLYKSCDNHEILKQILENRKSGFFISDVAVSHHLEFGRSRIKIS
jgi:two-component system NarL family response regulator